MQLRKATLEDARELADLLKDVGWFEAFASESLDETARLVRARLEQCLADDSHVVYVAETEERKIIGYVAAHWLPYLFMRGPEGYVSELFVRAAERGQGVGWRLLEQVQAEAHRRGCSRLSLINLRDRESYRRGFYVKNGWLERPAAANFVFSMA